MNIINSESIGCEGERKLTARRRKVLYVVTLDEKNGMRLSE
jgi:hypothetical protein